MSDTVYTCDNCPHAGDLMCCHNCPNFQSENLEIKRSDYNQFSFENLEAGFLVCYAVNNGGAGSFVSHEQNKSSVLKDFYKRYGKNFAITQIIDLSKVDRDDSVVIEKWELEEISEAIRVALNVQYGINGLMTDEEVKHRIKNTHETALMRMLKKAGDFCNQYLNK